MKKVEMKGKKINWKNRKIKRKKENQKIMIVSERILEKY